MIRQAHTYLAGALSGTALVAAAVVAFIALVSLQAVRDWPFAGLVAGGDNGSVSTAHHVARGTARATAHRATARAAGRGAAAGGGNVSSGGGEGLKSSVAAPAPVEEGTAIVPSTGASRPAPKTESGSEAGSGGGSGNSGSTAPGVGETVSGTAHEATSGAGAAAGGAAGAVGGSGVGHAVEEVVSGVAGPQSPVGGTVGKGVKTVGGLLPGGN